MCLKIVLFVQIILSILSFTTASPMYYGDEEKETHNPKIKRENSLIYNYHYEEKPEEGPSDFHFNQHKITTKREKPIVSYKFNIDVQSKKNHQEYFTAYKTKEHSQEIQHKESSGNENKYEHSSYVKYHEENKNEPSTTKATTKSVTTQFYSPTIIQTFPTKKQPMTTVSTLNALNGVVDQEVLDLTNDIVKAIEHNIEKSESQDGETFHVPESNQKVKVKLWYAGNEDENTQKK